MAATIAVVMSHLWPVHARTAARPAGPRIEEKNFYGAAMIGALVAFGYGLLGAVIGLPAGFIINVTR
ncbi:hypothetical protein [Bradyrhizobium brasilense]|uniref:Uncharacterized protein n=1 Tax=Bradyrhizobium brasilense TaxID=1419277 RepID=A0ABY8JA68_9BRAD|nr:hypothetical protein [Bradyrhizobium brasilense]WFU62470.1 hypothetical protein QA636_34045 [Bradyrhizobium brasilense]